MEYGSIFGHGAYLGPDFTTEYLHRAALSSISFYGGQDSDSGGRAQNFVAGGWHNPITSDQEGFHLVAKAA